jgi:signal transduction histidine kinase
MGLDTSYRIVVAMHFGTLKVESAPGKTCFRVWLPQSLPVAAADRQAVTIDV